MTALQGDATLEDEEFSKLTLAQSNQKPGETIVSFQYGLWKPASSVFPEEAVCQKRYVPMCDHVCGIASSSALSMFNCKCHRAWKGPDFGKVGSSRS